MDVPPPPTYMTAEELLGLPDTEEKRELVAGILIRTPPTGGVHGKVSARIARILDEFVSAHDLGVVCGAETAFVLARDPDLVRAPDASFVARDRIPPDGVPERFWPLTPDLAVEVISPSDRAWEVAAKVADYLAAGTGLVWVMDPPTRSVHAHRRGGGAAVLGEGAALDGYDVLPGFACPVRRCFE